MNHLKSCTAAIAAVLSLALGACAGGGSTSNSNSSNGTDATVQGVTTPSSVSVVTAQNAGD